MTQGQGGGGVPPTMMMPGFPQQGFGQQQQQQPPQPMPPMQPPPAQPPKKSRWGLWVGGGCGGCLVICCVLCGIGGYLFYLEEGVSYEAPGDEIASIPIASGTPFTTNVEWDGTGYGDIRAYVDLGSGVTSGERITGNFGCEDYAGAGTQESLVDVYYYPSYGGSRPDSWVSLQNYDYRRGSSEAFPCSGTLNLPVTATNPRLVITVRQRPSDYMDGVF